MQNIGILKKHSHTSTENIINSTFKHLFTVQYARFNIVFPIIYIHCIVRKSLYCNVRQIICESLEIIEYLLKILNTLRLVLNGSIFKRSNKRRVFARN